MEGLTVKTEQRMSKRMILDMIFHIQDKCIFLAIFRRFKHFFLIFCIPTNFRMFLFLSRFLTNSFSFNEFDLHVFISTTIYKPQHYWKIFKVYLTCILRIFSLVLVSNVENHWILCKLFALLTKEIENSVCCR